MATGTRRTRAPSRIDEPFLPPEARRAEALLSVCVRNLAPRLPWAAGGVGLADYAFQLLTPAGAAFFRSEAAHATCNPSWDPLDWPATPDADLLDLVKAQPDFLLAACCPALVLELLGRPPSSAGPPRLQRQAVETMETAISGAAHEWDGSGACFGPGPLPSDWAVLARFALDLRALSYVGVDLEAAPLAAAAAAASTGKGSQDRRSGGLPSSEAAAGGADGGVPLNCWVFTLKGGGHYIPAASATTSEAQQPSSSASSTPPGAPHNLRHTFDTAHRMIQVTRDAAAGAAAVTRYNAETGELGTALARLLGALPADAAQASAAAAACPGCPRRVAGLSVLPDDVSAEDGGDAAPELCDDCLNALEAEVNTLLAGGEAAAARVAKLDASLASTNAHAAAAKRALAVDAAVLREAASEAAALAADLPAMVGEVGTVQSEVRVLRQFITAKQLSLLSDLRALYPIKEVEAGRLYTIADLPLPESELTAASEDQVATALGYAAHLVLLTAKYLGVPLRYQPRLLASRSTMRDEVLGALVDADGYDGGNGDGGSNSGSSGSGSGNGGGGAAAPYAAPEYPLFWKGLDHERFMIGVRMLQYDVKQLLHSQGLALREAPPGSLGLLPNLARLFAALLDAPTTAPQPA